MRKIFIITMLTLIGFASAQSVQAQAPVTSNAARIAISPYAQAVPNDSYTFIGISHPSLDSAASQIGLSLEVLNMTTSPNTAAGRATTFTISSGETHRVFIVETNNTSINPTSSAFSDARTHIITTASSAQFGSVRVVGINEAPQTPTLVGSVNKFNNLGQLDMWGVVFAPSSNTGFAMEFIGDAHDSTIGGNLTGLPANGLKPSNLTTGAGRGIN